MMDKTEMEFSIQRYEAFVRKDCIRHDAAFTDPVIRISFEVVSVTLNSCPTILAAECPMLKNSDLIPGKSDYVKGA